MKMCKHCSTPDEQPRSRLQIWQMPANLRCAVIGTCLDIPQLKRVLRRFQSETAAYELNSDYRIHSYFVSISSSKNPISQHLNKTLNRLYESTVRNTRSIKTEHALLSQWQNIDTSDVKTIAGYFWALLTNKHATEALRDEIYGDVHMISHIAGQENRNGVRLLRESHQHLASENKKQQRLLEQKNRKITDLNDQMRTLRQQLAQSQIKARDKKKPLNQVNDEVGQQRKIRQQQQLIHSLKSRLNKAHTTTAQTATAKNHFDTSVNALTDNTQLSGKPCHGECTNCQKTGLCGKKILYVGGFSRHRKKFQQITESIGGQFFYHDGGKQQSEHQLDNLVKKADAVFCPVDCVSHSAIGRIKSLVKSHCKDCIYLKSASLSSFKNEVNRYAS